MKPDLPIFVVDERLPVVIVEKRAARDPHPALLVVRPPDDEREAARRTILAGAARSWQEGFLPKWELAQREGDTRLEAALLCTLAHCAGRAKPEACLTEMGVWAPLMQFGEPPLAVRRLAAGRVEALTAPGASDDDLVRCAGSLVSEAHIVATRHAGKMRGYEYWVQTSASPGGTWTQERDLIERRPEVLCGWLRQATIEWDEQVDCTPPQRSETPQEEVRELEPTPPGQAVAKGKKRKRRDADLCMREMCT
jgi:hypothetical protein